MDKKLIIALILGAGLVVSAVVLAVNKDEKVTENKPVITDIKTNSDPVPQHMDNEEDKDPEVIEHTKGLAEKFILQLATMDPENPNAYLEHVKDITEENLYLKLENAPRRPTAASYKRVIKEVIAYPVDDVLPDRKKWNVIAVDDVYDSTGKMSSEEIYYWVSVAMVDEEWKVTGFEVGQ